MVEKDKLCRRNSASIKREIRERRISAKCTIAQSAGARGKLAYELDRDSECHDR
jgi:hypothetical protein